MRKFQWAFYAELESQRSAIRAKLHKALLEAAKVGWKFSAWQRAVKTRWALRPLSAGGSLGFPGGRFNYGEFELSFPQFPALYLAEDKTTAIDELLAQDIDRSTGLTAHEYALAKPDSIAFYSVTGKLDTVIDLNDPAGLELFMELVKSFTINENIKKMARDFARELHLPPPINSRVSHQMTKYLRRARNSHLNGKFPPVGLQKRLG